MCVCVCVRACMCACICVCICVKEERGLTSWCSLPAREPILSPPPALKPCPARNSAQRWYPSPVSPADHSSCGSPTSQCLCLEIKLPAQDTSGHKPHLHLSPCGFVSLWAERTPAALDICADMVRLGLHFCEDDEGIACGLASRLNWGPCHPECSASPRLTTSHPTAVTTCDGWRSQPWCSRLGLQQLSRVPALLIQPPLTFPISFLHLAPPEAHQAGSQQGGDSSRLRWLPPACQPSPKRPWAVRVTTTPSSASVPHVPCGDLIPNRAGPEWPSAFTGSFTRQLSASG